MEKKGRKKLVVLTFGSAVTFDTSLKSSPPDPESEKSQVTYAPTPTTHTHLIVWLPKNFMVTRFSTQCYAPVSHKFHGKMIFNFLTVFPVNFLANVINK